MVRIDTRLIEVQLGPVIVIGRRREMGGGPDGQNSAGARERFLDSGSSGAELSAQVSPPCFRIGFRIVDGAAPDAMAVFVFVPIPLGT